MRHEQAESRECMARVECSSRLVPSRKSTVVGPNQQPTRVNTEDPVESRLLPGFVLPLLIEQQASPLVQIQTCRRKCALALAGFVTLLAAAAHAERCAGDTLRITTLYSATKLAVHAQLVRNSPRAGTGFDFLQVSAFLGPVCVRHATEPGFASAERTPPRRRGGSLRFWRHSNSSFQTAGGCCTGLAFDCCRRGYESTEAESTHEVRY